MLKHHPDLKNDFNIEKAVFRSILWIVEAMLADENKTHSSGQNSGL